MKMVVPEVPMFEVAEGALAGTLYFLVGSVEVVVDASENIEKRRAAGTFDVLGWSEAEVSLKLYIRSSIEQYSKC